MSPQLELQIKINFGTIQLVNESNTLLAEINHHPTPWYSSHRTSSFSVGDKKIILSGKSKKVVVMENDLDIGSVAIGDRTVFHLNDKVFDLYKTGIAEIYHLTDQKNPVAILTGKMYREREKSLFGIFYSPRVLYFSVTVTEDQVIHYELLRLLMISGYCLQAISEMNRS
jgi:hypothetical protein